MKHRTRRAGGGDSGARARAFARGQDYIVRDARVLREVADLWEPVNRIGSADGRKVARWRAPAPFIFFRVGR